jgi:hypothetical protein
MIWTPYQIAQAGMIGTDQVVQTAPTDRGTILSFIDRADVTSQLQAFGIDSKNAKDRVAALTDEEARFLAGKIQSQPAGAVDGWVWVVLIVLVAAAVWWAWKR